MIDGKQALARLVEGNRRFLSGRSGESDTGPGRREEVAEGQAPFAIVLGCSDSRVPVETVFDEGLGDLFVIRVAGNVLESTQAASIEFAVQNFGSPLVVILGHSGCGAVNATAAALADPESYTVPNAIVEALRPVMEPLMGQGRREEFIAKSVRANVRAVTDALRKRTPALADPIREGRLLVVGAEYDLESGRVDFFDMGDQR